MIILALFSFIVGFGSGIWVTALTSALFDKKGNTTMIQVGGDNSEQTQIAHINNNTNKDNDDYMEFLNRIHRCHDCIYAHWYIDEPIFGTELYCKRIGYPVDMIKCTECSDKEIRKDLRNLTNEESIAYEKILNENSESTGITL